MFEGKTRVIIAVLIVIASFFSWWFWQPEDQMQQEELFAWIDSGYSQQFCNVILPNFQHCVSLTKSQCPGFASAQIQPCLIKLGAELPDYQTAQQRREIYNSVGACFQAATHDELVSKYLVDSDECRALMK